MHDIILFPCITLIVVLKMSVYCNINTSTTLLLKTIANELKSNRV